LTFKREKSLRPFLALLIITGKKENLKVRGHLGDLDIDGGNKIGLQQYMRTWIGLGCDV